MLAGCMLWLGLVKCKILDKQHLSYAVLMQLVLGLPIDTLPMVAMVLLSLGVSSNVFRQCRHET